MVMDGPGGSIDPIRIPLLTIHQEVQERSEAKPTDRPGPGHLDLVNPRSCYCVVLVLALALVPTPNAAAKHRLMTSSTSMDQREVRTTRAGVGLDWIGLDWID
jgi:hypothetical protein